MIPSMIGITFCESQIKSTSAFNMTTYFKLAGITRRMRSLFLGFLGRDSQLYTSSLGMHRSSAPSTSGPHSVLAGVPSNPLQNIRGMSTSSVRYGRTLEN